jgi:hypothetical protein
MRGLIVLIIALALGGCSELDRQVIALRQRLHPRPAPVPLRIRAAECTFPWTRDLPRPRRGDYVTDDVVVEGLLDREPAWWYQPAREVARHLRSGPPPSGWTEQDALDFAQEALDNGPDRFVAHPALVNLRARHEVTISVPEYEPNVALHNTGVQAFGGFLPSDGVKVVHCKASDFDTSFHIAFIVAGPRCVPITLRSGRTTDTRRVPFGADC